MLDPAGTAQRYMFRTLLLLTSLLLSSCSNWVKQESTAPENWLQTHQHHSAIENWRITARMAMQSEQQGGSLDVFWTQRGEIFDIRMVAPMGQGAVHLKGNANSVDARLPDGRRVRGSPDDLLQQAFGVEVPVDALIYWLRGIAFDADYRRASWNEQGRLHEINQHGWRVEMREYTEASGYQLPTRFYLETSPETGTNMRFIIRRWNLQG